MANDKKKELMVQFCIAYRSILAQHTVSATATTGRLVAAATGLPIQLYLSREQGTQQIGARITYNEIDMVFYFTNPDSVEGIREDACLMETLRLCDTYNVPIATNLASAEMLIMGLQNGDLAWRDLLRSED